MPLNRYHLRNEYSLADPELYKIADKDDPEALLEGVAMAGLVGVLRQLGDLAEFAAEIFHDLHEEVMATAARGHGLIVRVQQLESEFPSIERTLLSETSHTAFLYNSGVDCHPNIRMDQSVVTRGDLPRFVMDSYEECRGPPRLFLLDKFDVAGAGACLKRFTDPSFFKTESTSLTGRKLEGQREKKTRRVKKRGPRWRNGDTPESFPSSHAKLHQLFLEERIESGINYPARRVKLKKRQYTGSLFDQDNVKSYMEKFLDTSPQEQKNIHEIYIDPLALTWTSDNACEGLPIVEIDTISPVKESIQADRSLCSSPGIREMVVNPSLDDFNQGMLSFVRDNESVEVPGLNHESHDDSMSTIPKLAIGKEVADGESKSEVSIDDACNSDDVASEIDNYVDALANIESEVETDTESKKIPRYVNLKPVVADSDGSERQRELQSVSLDSQSVGNSATSEDGYIFSKERERSSCSNSVKTLTETSPDLDAAVVAVPTIEAFNSDSENMSFDHHSTSGKYPKKEMLIQAAANTFGAEVGISKRKQVFSEASNTSSLEDINQLMPLDTDASLKETFVLAGELDESARHDIVLGETDPGHAIQSAIVPSNGICSDASEDNGHCFSVDPSIHKEDQISSAYPAMPCDVSNVSDGSVHLLETNSHKSNSASSSVEGHDKDSGAEDVDACTGSGPPIRHLPVSDPIYPATKYIYVATEEDFCIPLTEHSSKYSKSAPDTAGSFGIQELLPRTTDPGRTPSLDTVAGNHPWEDPSMEEALGISMFDERVYFASHVGQAGNLPAVSNLLQTHPQELSSYEFTKGAEISDCDSLESGVAAVVSPRDESNGWIPRSVDEKAVDDSAMVGKPSSIVDRHEIQDEWLKIPLVATDTTLKELQKDETFNQYSEPDTLVDDLTSQATTMHVAASGDHASIEEHDTSKIFSHDESPLFFKHTHSDYVLAAENDAEHVLAAENDKDLDREVEKVEHIETVADGRRQVDVKDGHHLNVIDLSSPLSLHPEKLHEPLLATEEFCQNDEDLTKEHGGELTERLELDPVRDASVTSTANTCNVFSNDSTSILLDGSLSEDVMSSGKLDEEAPFASENSSQHLDPLSLDFLKQQFVEEKESTGAAALDYNDQPSVSKSSPQSAEHTLETSTLAFHGNGMLSGSNQATQANSIQPDCQQGLPDPGTHSVATQINLEPPSLPPLPPMQWRRGRFQMSASVPAERQLVQHTLVPLQVQPMGLPTIHHTLAPVQPITLPAVHPTFASFQPVTLAAGNTSLAQIPPAAIPAVHYTFTPLQQGILPTSNYGTETTSKTFTSEGQLGYSDGYVSQQGVTTHPMPVPVSEGFFQINTSIVGRQDNQSSTIPLTSTNLDGYVGQQGIFNSPMLAPVSEGFYQTNAIGVRGKDILHPAIASASARPPNGSQFSEESRQPDVDHPESGSSVEGHIFEHTSAAEAKVNAEVAVQNELLGSQLPEGVENSYVQSILSSTMDQPAPGLVAPELGRTWSSAYDNIPTHEDGNIDGNLQKKPPRPRNPLIYEVVAIDKNKLRKVEREKPPLEAKPGEGESLWEQMQLRKVERVKPPAESKVGGGENILEHLQLRKVGERVKPPVEPKDEEKEFSIEQLQLRKVGERLKPQIEPKSEEREILLEQSHLRKVREKAKQESEAKDNETESPRMQVRKVRERAREEAELKIEEIESPRMQLRKVAERAHPVAGQKVEERDSLFEQIRNKSFNLKPAVAARPNIQGPRTNLKVAAILEKASTIRQAMAGSDEDEDDADRWSDS